MDTVGSYLMFSFFGLKLEAEKTQKFQRALREENIKKKKPPMKKREPGKKMKWSNSNCSTIYMHPDGLGSIPHIYKVRNEHTLSSFTQV